MDSQNQSVLDLCDSISALVTSHSALRIENELLKQALAQNGKDPRTFGGKALNHRPSSRPTVSEFLQPGPSRKRSRQNNKEV